MLEGNPAQWLAHFKSLEERLINSVETVSASMYRTLASRQRCDDPRGLHHQPSRQRAHTQQDHAWSHRAAICFAGPNARQLLQVGSKIDFVLTIGDDEDVYLACECKRLNVPYKDKRRPLAHEYVRDGLSRFVTGQYANGLSLAMMIGYVMDAQVAFALDRLKKALQRSKIISLRSANHPLTVAGKPVRFVTTHQCAPGHNIEVRHTLLGWP